MKNLLPLLSIALLLFSCGGPSSKPAQTDAGTTIVVDPLDQAWDLVAALEGRWKNTMDSGDTLSYERWMRRDNMHWDGRGWVLVSGDTAFIEDLRLSRTASAIIYAARISTQNNGDWIEFQLQPRGADTLLFVNPVHDFPREIRYTRTAQGSWQVEVSGNGRSFGLHFVRSPV